MTAVLLLAILAALFPSSASALRLSTMDAIVDAATEHHVPVAMLSAVCWMESRGGTAPRFASLCGVRIAHVYVRNAALSADIAGRSLSRRLAECGTWPRALVAWRFGRGCSVPDSTGYARRTIALAARITARAEDGASSP